MYRQAIALSIQRQRPGVDVRVASPEDSDRELADFRPHLLVHNDGLGPEVVTDIPFQVEVQYSDGMDARISAEGELSTTRDMCMEDLPHSGLQKAWPFANRAFQQVSTSADQHLAEMLTCSNAESLQ